MMKGHGVLGIVSALVAASGLVALTTAPAAAASENAWLDPTFGNGGSTVMSGEGYGYEISNADALDRTYLATTQFNGGPTILRRLRADGTIDPAFAGGAGVPIPQPREIIADPGGTVTVFSRSTIGVQIRRYTGSGAPDTSFGANGLLLLPPADPSYLPWFTDAVPRPGGGYFVAFSNEYDLDDDIAQAYHYVSAVTAAGTLDPTWAADAPTPGYLPLPRGLEATSMALDGSRLLFAGLDPDPDGGYESGVIMRLTPDGKLDPTFSDDGVVTAEGHPHLVVVAGDVYYGVGFDGVTRLFRDGTTDLSFGDFGLARLFPRDPGERYGFMRVHLAPTRIVVTGAGGVAMGDLVPKVSRFTYAGKLDTGFGTDGVLSLPDLATGSYHLGFATTVQSDGRIIGVAGVGSAVAIRINTTRTPPLPVGGAFVALSPARILDTREAIGVTTTTPVPGRGSVTLQVTGAGGVPSSGVSAVVLNVTVTEPTREGYITAYPFGTTRPTASNLNFVAGQTIPNVVTVPVSPGGKVTFYNGQTTGGSVHLIADVAGYYLAGDVIEPGAFTPLSPARIMDTRTGLGVGQPVSGNSSVTLPVTGFGGLPNFGVSAVVLNVTVTEPTREGYVTVYPSGTSRPTASNLNFVAGQTIANLVTVPVGTNGSIKFYNGQTTGGSVNLIADVAGYYLAGPATAPGTFVPLNPKRILDTREAVGVTTTTPVSGRSSVALQVSGAGGVPASGASAVVLNVTATAPTREGYITVYPSGTTRPTASNLNFVAGQTIPNLVVVRLGTGGKVTLYNGQTSGGSVHLIADVAGYFRS